MGPSALAPHRPEEDDEGMAGAARSPAGAARAPGTGDGRIRQLLLLAAGAAVYFGGREVVEGSWSDAVRHAEAIIDLERHLGVGIEADVQRLAVEHDALRVVGNLSYVWLHWPLLLAVLGWLLWRDRARYRRLRDAMFLSGAVALVIFAVFPVAPPRFMSGYVGTVSDAARRHYLEWIPLDWSNPYAAFPSFHVGWTLIACLALAASMSSRRAAVLAIVPAVLVGLSVVSTGNHYLVDAVGGAAIALAAYAWAGRRHAARTPVADADDPRGGAAPDRSATIGRPRSVGH
jgi:membrane-associated phospholipid phosphatase